MSVKEPYDSDWKEKVRTRIRPFRRRDRAGQQELAELHRTEVGNPCAKEEKQPICAASGPTRTTGRSLRASARSSGLGTTSGLHRLPLRGADMRKALIVGIDHYDNIRRSIGCVNDAHDVKAVLERNATVRSTSVTRLIPARDRSTSLSPGAQGRVRELFDDDGEIALFYFAGHGYIEATGGYLCGSDCRTGDDGFLSWRSDLRQRLSGPEQGHHPRQLPQRHRGQPPDAPRRRRAHRRV